MISVIKDSRICVLRIPKFCMYINNITTIWERENSNNIQIKEVSHKKICVSYTSTILRCSRLKKNINNRKNIIHFAS